MLIPLLAAALLSVSGPDPDGIEWFDGPYAAALERARAENRPLFVYFWMDGSDYCVRVYGETLNTDAAAAALGDFICYSANAADAVGAELIRRHHVSTLPTMLFLTPDGQVEEAILGYIPLNDFLSELQRIEAGVETVSARRAAAEAAPDDLDLRLTLAMKLDFVGDKQASEELLGSIREADPRGRTLAGARLALFDVRQAVLDAAADPGDLTTLDLRPLYRHLARVGHGSVAFDGWNWIAGIEAGRGERKKAREAFAAAWPHIAQSDVFSWGTEVVRDYWESRDELTRADRRFALEVALAAAAQAEDRLQNAGGEAELDDEGRNVVAVTLSLLAAAHALNGDRAEALAAIDRSIRLDPQAEGFRRLREQFAR